MENHDDTVHVIIMSIALNCLILCFHFTKQGPNLLHFRSATQQHVEKLLADKWKECVDGVQNRRISLPINVVKVYDKSTNHHISGGLLEISEGR